jgi:predicted naringenin-chalcone synthase
MPAFISSIGTAVPQFATHQQDIASFMIDRLGLNPSEATQLKVLYRASGIQTRYSVLPDFQQNGHDPFFKDGDVLLKPTVGSRMKLYQRESILLAESALKKAIDKVDMPVSDITHLITVSCTGMFAPGLDISLVEKLGLNTHVERTNINFMGCYAAFNAIKAARYIIESNSSAKVAVVCVELCSIHFQDKTDEDTLLANALFGDGAAAMIMTSGGHAGLELEIMDNYSDLSLLAKDEMTWNIGDNGFDMKLSGNVPDIIKSGIHDLTHQLLNKKNRNLSSID